MTAQASRPLPISLPRACGLAVALAAAGGAALADDPAPAQMAAEMTAAAARTLAITPEVTALHSRLTPPGPPALTSDGRPMTELSGVNARLWLSRGPAGIGVGIGTIGYVVPGPDGRTDGPRTLSGAAPTVSVAMRYRIANGAAVFADAMGARGLPPDTSGAYVNTKIGMEWKPATHTFGIDHGALGVHLDSGYRLSLKPRRGGIGVYLRGQF
ncbi:MAG TPA: hypothetical protein VGP22_05400 [Albitalea sp.]|jgi:hypothetical protein|nr:hypothetical protein [Albitalea sp.]